MKVWVAWRIEQTTCGCSAAYGKTRLLGVFQGVPSDVFKIFGLMRDLFIGEDYEGQTSSWTGKFNSVSNVEVHEFEVEK